MPQFRVTGTLHFNDGSPSFDISLTETASSAPAAISAAIAKANRLPAVELVDNVHAVLYVSEEVSSPNS